MRCLVVEDSQRLQTYVARGLRQAGYAVDIVSDGQEALFSMREVEYDVIVLDLMLPRVDGLTVLSRMKEMEYPAGILILSAKDTVEDRVRGLQSGADDYLIKLFALVELVARVQALVRRKYSVTASDLSIGKLRIDFNERSVSCGNEPVLLKPRDYSILEYLVLRAGEVVSKREIEYHIYDEVGLPHSNAVESAISSLRRKLHSCGNSDLIETRRGQGYLIRKGGS